MNSITLKIHKIVKGGVISPLLANIALHGMEEEINKVADSLPGNKKNNRYALSFIRYADDFIIIHPSFDVVNKCKDRISEWLSEMGLELKPSKTKIVHTLKPDTNISTQSYINTGGFDFLGFNVRQYLVGRTHSGKNSKGNLLGFKTLIKPVQKLLTSTQSPVPSTQSPVPSPQLYVNPPLHL